MYEAFAAAVARSERQVAPARLTHTGVPGGNGSETGSGGARWDAALRFTVALRAEHRVAPRRLRTVLPRGGLFTVYQLRAHHFLGIRAFQSQREARWDGWEIY